MTETFYDAMGRVTQEWQGANDVPTSDLNHDGACNPADFQYWVAQNPTATETDPATDYGMEMYKISASTYDLGDAGDGDLTQSTSYAGSGTTYVTNYQYDWGDRKVGTLGPDGVATMNVQDSSGTEAIDNLGEVTETQTYADASMSGGQIVLTAADLRAQTESVYDSQGRVYESRTYNVAPATSTDPSPGTVGYLPTDTWYDADGNVLATRTGAGAIEKSVYNGAGELVETYTCAETAATTSLSYNDATILEGADTVVEQDQTWYDADGNVIATADYQRLPGDTTQGALTAANSYVTATTSFYDLAGRDIEDVNYGRQDVLSGSATDFFAYPSGDLKANSDGNPSVAELTTPPSTGTADYIVTRTVYDPRLSAAGPIIDTIDNAGIVTETQTDLMGRTICTIQNYVNGRPEATETDQDVTTAYAYDPQGRLGAQVAFDANGDSVALQETCYVYESPMDGSLQTGVIYPDSTTPSQTYQIVTALSDSGGTATAAVTSGQGQDYAVGQWVLISGAAQADYNGWFRVTGNSANSFTYTVASTSLTSETGTFHVQAVPPAATETASGAPPATAPPLRRRSPATAMTTRWASGC